MIIGKGGNFVAYIEDIETRPPYYSRHDDVTRKSQIRTYLEFFKYVSQQSRQARIDILSVMSLRYQLRSPSLSSQSCFCCIYLFRQPLPKFILGIQRVITNVFHELLNTPTRSDLSFHPLGTST